MDFVALMFGLKHGLSRPFLHPLSHHYRNIANRIFMSKSIRITSANVIDLRVPTSDQMLGSDPFHKKPDYSSAVLHLETDAGLRGVSVVFTVGAGTDWICHGIEDLCQLVIGTDLADFSAAPINLYRRLIDHHQLRWLHDGVFRICLLYTSPSPRDRG